ncbi:MAG TPA: hypothetical protein VM912_00425, partial [Terriglobales bacterium]|nr:hypothetical protein [Terriglobales bacterium]
GWNVLDTTCSFSPRQRYFRRRSDPCCFAAQRRNHMLRRKLDYRELGPDYFDRLNQRHITNVLVRRLQRLGHNVILQPATAVFS